MSSDRTTWAQLPIPGAMLASDVRNPELDLDAQFFLSLTGDFLNIPTLNIY